MVVPVVGVWSGVVGWCVLCSCTACLCTALHYIQVLVCACVRVCMCALVCMFTKSCALTWMMYLRYCIGQVTNNISLRENWWHI